MDVYIFDPVVPCCVVVYDLTFWNKNILVSSLDVDKTQGRRCVVRRTFRDHDSKRHPHTAIPHLMASDFSTFEQRYSVPQIHAIDSFWAYFKGTGHEPLFLSFFLLCKCVFKMEMLGPRQMPRFIPFSIYQATPHDPCDHTFRTSGSHKLSVDKAWACFRTTGHASQLRVFEGNFTMC